MSLFLTLFLHFTLLHPQPDLHMTLLARQEHLLVMHRDRLGQLQHDVVATPYFSAFWKEIKMYNILLRLSA